VPHSVPALSLTAPKRWPWLLLAVVVGVATIVVLTALHEREQTARRGEAQATLFAAELRDSVRELVLFGGAIPERQRATALRPVVASTAATASRRLERLDAILGDDPRTEQLRRQLLEVGRISASAASPAAFGSRLKALAGRMARTADAIARDQHDRATLIARESMAGSALAVLLAMAIVVVVLQRAQQLLVAAGRRQAEQLRELAERDPLTGLANRRKLNDDLARLDPQLAPGAPVQVMICDLDGFKALNDRLGHEAGDELLIRFAGLLAEAAGADGVAYRLGGDEFCVLSRPGRDVAADVRLVLTGGADGLVTGSAGLALWPGDAPTARGAMRLADERMYAAKSARRPRAA
jgi:diguanylate cyclase (GGDEF)-like protein